MTNDTFHSRRSDEQRVLMHILLARNKIIQWMNCVGRVQGRGMGCIKACTVFKEQGNTVDELCRQSTRKRYGVY